DSHPNSVFTRSLLPLLERPGLTLPEVAQEVRRSVRELTQPAGHRQTPAYYDEVVGRFCMAGCTVVAAASPAATPTAPAAPVKPA
ncbi:hypothetical protein, partial [Klebsiella pneumoniae]|uniref:hypothetical protein n=1 Tax=Klebsiella pneumoniae TaxID=573 RepID=UPI00385557E9